MDLQKLESISKIIAAIFIPIVIAFLGNELSVANKKKDSETKLIELATVILTKEIHQNQTEDFKNVRTWAVDVINAYSGVPMTQETKRALVETVSIPATKNTEDSSGTYGVVFGGDKTLNEAQYEITTTAKKAGVEKAQVFLRSGSYRSVVVYTSRPEAEEALGKLKQIRASSFIVDMSKWCPNTIKHDNFYECRI